MFPLLSFIRHFKRGPTWKRLFFSTSSYVKTSIHSTFSCSKACILVNFFLPARSFFLIFPCLKTSCPFKFYLTECVHYPHPIRHTPPPSGRRQPPLAAGGRSQELSRMMEVRVFHRSRRKEANNPCLQATCSHLCLLAPSGYSCACPTGMVLEVRQRTHCYHPTAGSIMLNVELVFE